MIVVEGPDGAGKSTLTAHLSETFGLKIAERGTPNRDELYKVTRTDTYRALAQAVQGNEPAQLWDRLGLPSEFIYHGVVGRPCEFNDGEKEFILRVMDALRMPMVLCVVPFEVARDNCLAGHQMKGVNENFRKIWQQYSDWSFPHPNNTILYDYTGSNSNAASLEEVKDEIDGYLIERGGRQTC